MVLPFDAATDAPSIYIPNVCSPDGCSTLSSMVSSEMVAIPRGLMSDRRDFLLPGIDDAVLARPGIREPVRHIEIEDAPGVEPENIALRLLAEEWQVPDRARQIHVPMRIVRGIQQLAVRLDHLEGEFERFVVVHHLHRLG